MQQLPGKSKSGLKMIRSKADRMAEALEQGLKSPWQGVRPDLVLHKGAINSLDKQTYVLEDPVRGEHYELGEAEAQLFLCLVTEKDLKSAVHKLLRTTSLRPSVDDILIFLRMMQMERLTVASPEEALASALEEESEEKKKEKQKKEPGKGRGGKFNISKIYFFKIPVCRPDAFLNLIYPWLKPLWSKPFLFLYSVLGVVGLVLTVQQWELYFHSVSHIFTPKGLLYFFLCLYGAKIFHEFGHALAAKHYGVFVRRMGIYMMFFTPMLYTDATEAWKLPDRKGRLIIAGAGVMVEFYLACVSLFLWSVLPNGIIRSMMFYISGASLVSTLLVNVNPFMRFDGYYILMDYLRISNLRTRSALMYRHYLYQLFVGWKGPKPEEHPKSRFMAIFGFFCTVYLLVIVLSISITVYFTISKVLAVWGFCATIVVFYGFGMWKQAKYVFSNRNYWGSALSLVLRGMIFTLFVGYMMIPMPKAENLPAFFLYEKVAELEAPGRGKIVSEIPEIGAPVEKGALLLKLRDEKLEQELEKLRYDLAKVEANLENLPTSGAQGGYRNWLLSERERLQSSYDKTKEYLSQLEVRAPLSGHILSVNETLRKGAYVFKTNYLLTVGSDQSFEVRAYAGEDIYRRLKKEAITGGEVVFDDLETASAEAKFREILDFPVRQFPNDSIFDYAGGDIMAKLSSSQKKRTRSMESKLAYYPLVFDLTGLPDYLRHGTRCSVRVKGEKASLASMLAGEVQSFLSEAGLRPTETIMRFKEKLSN